MVLPRDYELTDYSLKTANGGIVFKVPSDVGYCGNCEIPCIYIALESSLKMYGEHLEDGFYFENKVVDPSYRGY